jgi:hypothetical protein
MSRCPRANKKKEPTVQEVSSCILIISVHELPFLSGRGQVGRDRGVKRGPWGVVSRIKVNYMHLWK